MSPEEQIAVVERAMDAWNDRDGEGLGALFAPDAEIHSAVAQTEGAGLYRGPEGARSWLGNNVDTLDLVIRERRFLPFRGLVLCLFEARVRGAASGVELKQEYGAVYEVRQGLITSALSFADQREAIEALWRATADAR